LRLVDRDLDLTPQMLEEMRTPRFP
jgi:hypothetical protein